MDYAPQINKAYLLIVVSLDLAPIEALFQGTDFTLEALQKTDSVNVHKMIPVVHNLMRYSNMDNVTAIYGQHLGVTAHGPVGYATLSAPTLGRALETFLEWFQVRCQTYSGKVIERDEYFELQVFDTTGDELFEAVFFEAFMRAFEVMIGLVLGHPPKNETTLHFKICTSDNLDAMRNSFDSKLFFDESINKLCVSKRLWFETSPLADKDSYELNLKKCKQLLEKQKASKRIDLQVRNLLIRHFDQTILSPDLDTPPPNLSMVAEEMNLTERTLIRRLKALNTSFKNILEEQRFHYAERLLSDARYTIYNVADILGYRESANFCRAFKRWTGQSPAEYRRLPFRKD